GRAAGWVRSRIAGGGAGGGPRAHGGLLRSRGAAPTGRRVLGGPADAGVEAGRDRGIRPSVPRRGRGTAGADQGARRRDGGRAGEPNRGAASEELREADGGGAARGREADEACEAATARA